MYDLPSIILVPWCLGVMQNTMAVACLVLLVLVLLLYKKEGFLYDVACSILLARDIYSIVSVCEREREREREREK